MQLAFIFVLVGYGTKAGLAPMHTWLPDAHSEAPSPTSAMLSGVSLKVAIYALLRFHILTTQCLGTGYSRNLLLGFGLFSMFLAAPFILVQSNLKRMLAYSSLEHVGLICTAVGLNTTVTIFGALLHMGYHALTKPVLFFAAGNIHQTFHTLKFRVIGPGVVQGAAGDGAVHGAGGGGGHGPAAVRIVLQRADRAQRRIRRGPDVHQLPDIGGADCGVLRHSQTTHPHPARRAQKRAPQRRHGLGRRSGDGAAGGRIAGVQRVVSRAIVAIDPPGGGNHQRKVLNFMHLIYFDESGQTGTNLRDTVQPVFVLGALVVPESAWLVLEKDLQAAIEKYFPAPRPENFEIHATEISNPRNGYFRQLAVAHRLAFRDEWFRIAKKHALKFVYRAISKKRFLEWSHTSFGRAYPSILTLQRFRWSPASWMICLNHFPVLLWEFLFRTKIVKSSEMLKRPSGFYGAWKEF